MTTEEKARAYDEILNKLRHFIAKGVDPLITRADVQDFFPELAESEDERIRKGIIAFLKKNLETGTADETWSISGLERWIAWLQGEQKPAEVRTTGYWNVQDIEQKPADKVVPKFKVGQWISGYYTNYKVLSVNNDGYVVEDVDGNKINILFENEKFHHLWTIRDAKDGDVLDANGAPFIYKKHDDHFVYFYCGVNLADTFIEATENDTWNGIIKVYPATKEQRDTLMKAMADAGYTFDFEKKEVKKIEQKSQRMISAEAKETLYDKPAWSEEDERNLKGIIDEIEANKNNAPDYDLATYDRFLSWLKSLRPQNTWKPSDKQMEALLSEVEGWTKGCPKQKVLESLYNDLKRLKGE